MHRHSDIVLKKKVVMLQLIAQHVRKMVMLSTGYVIVVASILRRMIQTPRLKRSRVLWIRPLDMPGAR